MADGLTQKELDHWCTYDAWTVDELAALSLGLDPRTVNPNYPEHCVPPELARPHMERLRRLRRAVSSGKLAKLIPPVDALKWADQQEIDVKPEFRAAIRRRSAKSEADANKRLRSELKLNKALLMEYYNFDENKDKVPLDNTLAQLCRKHGIILDPKTVRRIINDIKGIEE
jgi:hypothetical protein